MNRPLAILTCLFGLFSVADARAAASSFCQFSTSPDGLVSGAAYDVSAAYEAADCVVVARVDAKRGSGQPLAVTRVVKAANAASLSYVGQPASERPVYEGVRLPAGREFLLLLRMKSPGVYGAVDSEGAVCPNVFAVQGGYARLGNQAVPVDNLERFMESKPEAIAYP